MSSQEKGVWQTLFEQTNPPLLVLFCRYDLDKRARG